MRRPPLHVQVFLGMIAGAAIAMLLPAAAAPLSSLGVIFMRLLRMVIVPLVFTSIVAGVAGIGDPRALGRLGAKTMLYYLATSLFAILIGLVLANVIRPGANLHPPEGVVITADSIERPGSLADILVRMIPENPVQAATEGDILALIFFAIAFGLAVTFLPERPRRFLTDAAQALFDAMMKLTSGIILLAPLGVLGLIAGAVSTMGVGVFAQVAKYMLTVAFGLALHFLVVLPLLYWVFTRRSPLVHWRAMAAPLQLAFSTSSSSATLPVTMNTVERRAGVSNRVSSFVLPLGATVNMDGTALYECAGVLFIAQALDVGLTPGQQAIVVVTALLASIGAAGIPSAGLVMIFIVLEAVNLSNDAALALVGVMLAVDRPLDMARTMVNVTSDTVAAAIVAQSEGEVLDYDESASSSDSAVPERPRRRLGRR